MVNVTRDGGGVDFAERTKIYLAPDETLAAVDKNFNAGEQW